MATKKAPAFQFYSSDFMVAVMYWDHELIGMYIMLMCWQHQHGFISEKDMSNICKRQLEHIDNKLLSKFVKDENGNYYNQRLKEVIDKQNAYSESRSNNRKSSKKPSKKAVKKEVKSHEKDMSNICKTYDKHMEDEDRDKDISIINDLKINKYGEFENVVLSQDEFKKLSENYPKIYEDYIERLSIYIKQKGKKYKSHYATILSWMRKDKKEVEEPDEKTESEFYSDWGVERL